MHNRSIICAVDRKYTVKDIHRCIHAVMASVKVLESNEKGSIIALMLPISSLERV